MTEAYYQQGGRVINVADAREMMNGFLLCRTESCRAPVSFVQAHERQISERTISVKPYFRLTGGDTLHDETCPYNTRGQIVVIVRNSDTNVISRVESGEREFRLNILLDNPARLADDAVRASKAGSGRVKPPPPQKRYVRHGELTAYLRTINQIMKLRSRIEGNDELGEHIELNFKGVKVRWSNFYYEDETQYQKCFDYLKRLSVQPERLHPVCIQGRVKQVDPPTKKFSNYAVRLYSPYVTVGVDNIKRVPSVQIVLGEMVSDLAGRISLDTVIAVHAIWRVSESNLKEINKQKLQFNDIKCTVFNAQQIYVE